MANIIILYKLKSTTTQKQFEDWLHATNFPFLRKLKHVKSFVVYRVAKRVMGTGEPSIHYMALFDVPDIARFIEEDLADQSTQKDLIEFRSFVEDPEYLVANPV